MAYVNKMDIMGADFFRVVSMMKERLRRQRRAHPAAHRHRSRFQGHHRPASSMKAEIYYDDDGQAPSTISEIPEDLKDMAEEYHAAADRGRRRKPTKN